MIVCDILVKSEIVDGVRSVEGMQEQIIAERIGKVMSKYSDRSIVNFYHTGIEITDSYKVRSKEDRLQISKIIKEMCQTARTAENLAAEWQVHNLSYRLNIFKDHAKDVMLDYKGDPRKSVRSVTKLFEILKLY